MKDCRVWMYRGAWAEWDVADIEMCVPMSPEELREKRNAILRHQSQMESAPFLGNLSLATTNGCSGSVPKTGTERLPSATMPSVWPVTRQWKHLWNINSNN